MAEFSYIHIPFCAKKCKYCAFTSFVNLNLIDEYIDALCFQINSNYNNKYQKTLYFGGGTPSLLNLKQVEKIISKFNFDKKTEITFEINPENASPVYLKGLYNLGINRLSIGVQTFNDEILSETGRRHSAQDSINAVYEAKNAGFDNISIDLMYGLPNQKIIDLKNDLKIIKSLPISHISTYGLKIEEKTYYAKFMPKALPDDDVQAEMYKEIVKKLSSFYRYEISNFAYSKETVSKHNLNYWNVLPYNAFGVSASGFDGKIRYKNTENLKKFLKNPLLKDEIIDADLLEEMIFLGFRKAHGINVFEINEKFNLDFDDKFSKIIEKYLKTGHILKTENGYKLSIDGILISNYILCDFLC